MFVGGDIFPIHVRFSNMHAFKFRVLKIIIHTYTQYYMYDDDDVHCYDKSYCDHPIFCSVWRDWIVVNDTFVGLNYVLGEQCGAVDREAKVKYM